MQWPKVQLGTAVTILDSMRKPVKAGDRIEGPYPYYGANGQQGTINDFIFDEPLILVAEDGGHFFDPSRPIAYRIEGKTWVNNHAHVLRCNPDMDISYLCHQLARYNVQQYLTGSTRAKLTKGALERIPITKPPLKEQKRIAAILDKIYEIKSKTQYSNEIRDGFIKSIFLEMFGDPRIQGNYPRKKFSDVAEVVTGTTPSTNHPEYYGGDVPFVKPPDLCGQVINKTITFLTSEGASKSRLIPKNSVMVSCIGILGKTALAGTSLCTNQQINSLIFNEEIIRPLFGFHYCSFIGELLDSMAPATTVPLVNKFRFSEIDIPIPPIELQLQFEKICVEFSSTITHDSQVEDLAISISQELLANQ